MKRHVLDILAVTHYPSFLMSVDIYFELRADYLQEAKVSKIWYNENHPLFQQNIPLENLLQKISDIANDLTVGINLYHSESSFSVLYSGGVNKPLMIVTDGVVPPAVIHNDESSTLLINNVNYIFWISDDKDRELIHIQTRLNEEEFKKVITDSKISNIYIQTKKSMHDYKSKH